MVKKILFVLLALVILIPAIAGLTVLVPNKYGESILREAKARGILAYSKDDAVEIAYKRCTSCHDSEKMLKYCSRCGPPFIVVVHFMKNHIRIAQKQGKKIKQLTDAEAVAIVQVWNALVGNWDDDWKKEDIKKMLDYDVALIALLDTPVENRSIESALRGKLAPGTYKQIKVESGNVK